MCGNTDLGAGRGGHVDNAAPGKFGRVRMIGVPLDVGVGRGVGDLRNACIPQTNVILARAGFSLDDGEWESGARVVELVRGLIAGQ
ncbi:hypothetical protein ACPUER_18295 [Burkholderia sp. DN3021]|uniref:hypothetical protein n=1 Tax=Burkholderia sp. DN3021 TaxID=3410137 RepID=UPI003C7CB876